MTPDHDWVPDLWNRTLAALDPHAAGDEVDGDPGDRGETTDPGDPYCVQYDWGSATEPSEAVVAAVAAVTNRGPTTVPPLYDWVDPDALDRLLTRDGADAATDVHVSFGYAGVDVVVDSTGALEVCAPPEVVD